MMKLSIIVPVYNEENRIRKCIESIINQTFRDFELIVLDDESMDQSAEIIETILKETNLSYHIISSKHIGSSKLRELGIKHALGEWIGFVDGDDYVESNYYEEMMRYVNDYDMITSSVMIDNERKNHQHIQKNNVGEVNQQTAKQQLLNHEGVYPYLCNKIIKKELFNNVVFPEDMIGEDFIVVMQLIDNAKNIINIDNPGYHYCLHAHNQSHDVYSHKYRKTYEVFQDYYDHLNDQSLKEPLSNYMVLHYMAILMSMNRSQEYDKEIEDAIIQFIKKHKHTYMNSKDSFIMKCAVRILCFNKDVFYRIAKVMG